MSPAGTGYVGVGSVRATLAPTGASPCVGVRGGKAVDVHRASHADGTAVIQWLVTGASNRRWASPSTGPAATPSPVSAAAR
ncbi:hypothetical protein ACH4MA_27515 [Streptomyces roseolus]|uniref:hypothetical protein n=1 Tax=Streptomyces roseolus TaxID=67358 RepID=UPI0037BC365E